MRPSSPSAVATSFFFSAAGIMWSPVQCAFAQLAQKTVPAFGLLCEAKTLKRPRRRSRSRRGSRLAAAASLVESLYD